MFLYSIVFIYFIIYLLIAGSFILSSRLKTSSKLGNSIFSI